MPGRDTFSSFRREKGGLVKLLSGPCWLLFDFLPRCGLLSKYIKVPETTKPFASILKSDLVRSMAEMLGCSRARVSLLERVEGRWWRREDQEKLLKVGSAAESVSWMLTPQFLRH